MSDGLYTPWSILLLWYANYPNLGTAETYEPAKRVTRSRYGLPLAIPYLVMFTKGPLHVPITSGSVVGGVTWGLRKGFDVAPRGARAPRAWPRARPFPVTARFGHPLLENRFPSHLYRIRSLGKLRARRPCKLPALDPINIRFLDKSKIWLMYVSLYGACVP